MIPPVSTTNRFQFLPTYNQILPISGHKLAIITSIFCALFLAMFYAVFRPSPIKQKQIKVAPTTAKLPPLKTFLSLYQPHFAPRSNKKNLNAYHSSKEFKKHAESVKVYYNQDEMCCEDAKRVISEREPTNIDAIQYYDKSHLKSTYGYSESVYNSKAKKKNNEHFSSQPNTACIFTRTYLWPTPGGDKKLEVGILNVPAPSLDVALQPHFSYYVNDKRKLIKKNYKKEMDFLAKTIVKCLIDHKKTKRIVIPKYGQENFLKGVNKSDRVAANAIFYQSLIDAFSQHKSQLKDFPISMSAYTADSNKTAQTFFVNEMVKSGFTKCTVLEGDIKKVAKEGDLIVNAWDPHSMVGNGNDSDNSFDGQIGRSTGAVLTCTPQLNPLLKQDKHYLAIRSK